jgi:hypothetical protein
MFFYKNGGSIVKSTQKNGQTKMKPPVKSLLSFISRSQAPGWITFGAEYIKAKI